MNSCNHFVTSLYIRKYFTVITHPQDTGQIIWQSQPFAFRIPKFNYPEGVKTKTHHYIKYKPFTFCRISLNFRFWSNKDTFSQIPIAFKLSKISPNHNSCYYHFNTTVTDAEDISVISQSQVPICHWKINQQFIGFHIMDYCHRLALVPFLLASDILLHNISIHYWNSKVSIQTMKQIQRRGN